MADTTAPRCEPPAHLRDRDGWHWLVWKEPTAKPILAEWYAEDAMWTPARGSSFSAGSPYAQNFRYDSALYSPSDVAALVAAAQGLVGQLAGLSSAAWDTTAQLRTALSPFTSEADHV